MDPKKLLYMIFVTTIYMAILVSCSSNHQNASANKQTNDFAAGNAVKEVEVNDSEPDKEKESDKGIEPVQVPVPVVQVLKESVNPPIEFVAKSIEVNGQTRKYMVYIPKEYKAEDTAAKWPLILFHHGAGEAGTDGERQTKVGIGNSIKKFPEKYPAIVLMPQRHPDIEKDHIWRDTLAKTLEEYNIDENRIYKTGWSAGGYTTWIYGHEDRIFAALMPISGGGRPEENAAELSNIPIWAFHGVEDDIVPVSESRKMVDAVKNAGGNVEYTEFPNKGHNIWANVYTNKEYIDWLLGQTKAESKQ